jgi:hypothetical protein
MAKQKMVVSEDQPTMMIPSDSSEQAPKHSHKPQFNKMKVNISLHSGRAVQAGDAADLTAEELEHLKAAFGDGLKHILE